MLPVARDTCPRCRRPLSGCWCAGLDPIATRTEVLFLQHPREAKVAIGTARMAHLALSASELHEGMTFSANARVQALIAEPGTALLFPGPDAKPLSSFDPPPKRLVVLDGTWPQARKMFLQTPELAELPRIGFSPEKPGNYRIRKEPAAHCLATIEAVVEVLTILEGGRERFAPMLKAFEQMVDFQIASAAKRSGPPRHRAAAASPWWSSAAMPDLAADWTRLVVVAAEANAHRRGSGVEGNPELVHLVAARPASGERFEAVLAPRRPLAPGAPHHLELDADRLLNGESVASALERWTAFARPDDRLVAWGPFPLDLLAQEGWRTPALPVDLRVVGAHRLRKRPGAPESFAKAIGLQPALVAGGRAVKTLAALVPAVERLREEILIGRAAEAARVPRDR